MPGHYSYASDDILEYYEKAIPILKDTSIIAHYVTEKLIALSAEYRGIKNNYIEDIKIITSDYLIYTIDKAFELWNKPWALHLSFDEFCETLLPYKCVELQQLDYWRDTLASKFTLDISQEDSLITDYIKTPINQYIALAEDINNKISVVYTSTANDYFKPLSAETISLLRFGTCNDCINIFLPVMRSFGIPVIKESIPQWGKTNVKGHTFMSLINKTNIYLNIPSYEITTPEGIYYNDISVPKVFRETYSQNKRVVEYYKDSKHILGSIDIFSTDITDQYFSTSDISIPISRKGLKDKYAYLAMFGNLDWQVLDFGKIKNGIVNFEKVGRDNVYIILGYNGDKLIPISDPFFLHNNAVVDYVNCDTTELNQVKLYRKFYLRRELCELASKAKGEIQASNYPNFREYQTMCEITTPGALTSVDSNNSYRYWRFCPSDDSSCNIAELIFFKDNNQEALSGEMITNIIENIPGRYSSKFAFDGDWLTTVNSEEKGAWIGLDFGEPISISTVISVPRGDDNNIHLGDHYELKYWNNDKWNSLGIQVATDNYLEYNNVPSNTILWLSDLTQGKQERIFTYENDRQVWW
ncbi:MAG: hypothetical protein SNG84_09415 [Rikenellaceae bacterium]